MRRFLAVLGALGMIGIALFVRDALDDDSSPSSDGGNRDGTVVVCADGLEAACRALDRRDDLTTRIERAGDTAAALQNGSFDGDAWLAPAPWVSLVSADDDSPLARPTAPIARARVAVLVDATFAPSLAAACDGTVTWRCLGLVAEQRVRGIPRVEVGLVDPESGVGLPVLGAAATGYFGKADFAANDFSTDPDFDTWLAGLAANAGEITDVGRHPAERLLTERGRFTAVATPSAFAGGNTADGRIVAVYPAPVVTVDLVLAPVRGRLDDADARGIARDERLVDTLVRTSGSFRDRLSAWLRPGVAGLPAGTNQPRGGVLAALLERWREAR